MRALFLFLTLTIISIIPTSSMAACGFWDPLGSCKAAEHGADTLAASMNATIEQMKKSLADMQKAVLDASNVLAVSVPGERYLRLIDDLNGTDDEKKKQARAFLRNLANIDPDTKYELAVTYEFDGSKEFFADFNRFPSTQIELLRQFVQDAIAVENTPSRGSLEPLTEDDVRAHLSLKANELYSLLRGEPAAQQFHSDTSNVCSSGGDSYCAHFTFPSPFIAAVTVNNKFGGNASAAQAQQDMKDGVDKFSDLRGRFVSSMTDIVMSTYPYRSFIGRNTSVEKDWPVLDDKNFVVVFIDKNTYDTHNETWKIGLNVHEKGKPGNSLYQRPTLILKREDFDPSSHQPLTGPRGHMFYWAYREMTGEFSPNVSQLAALRALQESLKQYNALLSTPSKQ